MSESFNNQRGLIVVPTDICGPAGRMVVRLALDTGATRTMVNVAILVNLGYNPSLVQDRVQVTTGSGVEFSPLVKIQRIAALSHERTSLEALAHTLPSSAPIDGLLGLDFFRDRLLEIDFHQGILSLS